MSGPAVDCFQPFRALAQSEALRFGMPVEYQCGDDPTWHRVSGKRPAIQVKAENRAKVPRRSNTMPLLVELDDDLETRRLSLETESPKRTTRNSVPHKRSQSMPAVREVEEARVTEMTLKLLRETLANEYQMDADLPSPDNLQLSLAELPGGATARKIARVIAPETGFLRALRGEIENPQRPANLDLEYVHKPLAQTCRSKFCKNEYFCPCPRRFFLKVPTAAQMWKEIIKHPASAALLEEMVHVGPTASVSLGAMPSHRNLKDITNGPFLGAMKAGLNEFVEEAKKATQRHNIVAAICSPSTYLEALLTDAAKHKRQYDEVLLGNPVARSYLRGPNEILSKFPSEVEHLVNAKLVGRPEIYELLLPYYEEVADSRGFEPLKKTQDMEKRRRK